MGQKIIDMFVILLITFFQSFNKRSYITIMFESLTSVAILTIQAHQKIEGN